MLQQHLIVSPNGNGDFTRIQDAIDAVRVHPLQPVVIYVKNGLYEEKVIIPDNKPNITIKGESEEDTIIYFNEYAEMQDADGTKYGTFRTSVFSAHADDIRMENITIQNISGYGKEIGQALALYISGDRTFLSNVRLKGNQDTLYLSKGCQYIKRCYIEGHVDYIFGSATTVFEQCEIHSLRGGYITAASTPKDKEYGFVFIDCKLTGSATNGTVYLGRPWRPYAHTVFIRTWMGSHIKPEGWDNWHNKENERTARYAEYHSEGPGSNSQQRVEWSSHLTHDEVNELALEKIFGSQEEWLPH